MNPRIKKSAIDAANKTKLIAASIALSVAVEQKRRIARSYRIKNTAESLENFIKKNSKDMRFILEAYYRNDQNIITRKVVSEMMGFATSASEYLKTFEENTTFLKNGIASSWLTAIKDQMRKISEIITKWLKSPFMADPSNERLLQYINNEALKFAVGLAKQRRLVLQDSLAFFINNDISLNQATPLMRQQIVLTQRQAKNVRKAYVRALNSGKTRQEALAIAKRASEKAKDRRARTQIRTELGRAKHEADLEALRQGVESGKLSNVYKTWRKTGYNDNWQSSIDNDGITVPIDGLFSNGMSYPSEINDRCVLEYLMIRSGA